MNSLAFKKVITLLLGLVWLINGLLCKILNLVPRHQAIVGSFLGNEHSFLFTKVIGILEIIMAIWVWSRIRPALCAVIQVILILVMNTLEFIWVPELLLFGRFNAVLALMLILLIVGRELGSMYSIHPRKLYS